jgi:hypothetical protein
MFRDVPTCSGCIWNHRPYRGMPLECLRVDSELILRQDPIIVFRLEQNKRLKNEVAV